MIRTTIEFNLLAPERLSDRAQTQRRKELETLIGSLAARNIRGDWEIDLDSPKLPDLVRILKGLHNKRSAWTSFVGIEERLVDDDRTHAEWFLLEPEQESHLDQCFLPNLLEQQVYPFGNPAHAKPGAHVALWGIAEPLVSDRFKVVVEKHGLTGLEFLWVRDTGRYQAQQWYLPLPREPLGRGLDHPWFDPAKCVDEACKGLDPRARHGERIASSLGGFTLRSNASFGDPVKDQFLALAIAMSKKRMLVISYPRYLRRYLPSTDFAFTLDDRQYGDDIQRDRGLAMSRRARDVLLANRLVTEEECIAVKVLDRPPKGVENLDRRCGKPEPLLSAEDFARLRAQESALWAEHLRNPKPPRVPNLARSLSLLRSAKRRAPQSFPKPATPKAIAAASRAVGIEIPVPWQKALGISNGGKVENSPLACEQACLIVPVEQLAKSQREEVEYYRKIGAALPKGAVLVVQTEIGDSMWLDTRRPKQDGDCRVVLMSHETGEELREWPSVAEFLEELLTPDANP